LCFIGKIKKIRTEDKKELKNAIKIRGVK